MKRTLTVAAAAVTVSAALIAPTATAGSGAGALSIAGFRIQGVADANPRDGIQNNRLADGLANTAVAWGNLPLTNPDTAAGITHYGYNTSTIAAGAGLTQGPKEAFKTEPDKNVYLAFGGKHYLYQGHETGPRGYVTRIDLDEKDPSRRVSLVADVTSEGTAFPTIDGITWNPFTKQLLITAEGAGLKGGVWGIGLDAHGDATTKAVPLPALGKGGYEGIQADAAGNIWIVEDTGGKSVDGGKVPASYVFRFVPTDKSDLTKGGALQAMTVLRPDGKAVTAAELAANPRDAIITRLHTMGATAKMRWTTIHEGTTEVFNANEAAAAKGGTPMKRPENGVFRPGTNFSEFYFSETGDTSTDSTLPGAWGGIFKITVGNSNPDVGTLSLAIPGDKEHAGMDNLAFLTQDVLLVVEDAGDKLHGQRNALDSGYAYDLKRGTGNGRKAPQPVRFLAEGRDASATYDALNGIAYNDGDNEITGIHVSDGDPSVGGLLGAKSPTPTEHGWRIFWTQQHGDNTTYEITRR